MLRRIKGTHMTMVSFERVRFHFNTISSQTTGVLPCAMSAPWVLSINVARASTKVVLVELSCCCVRVSLT